MIYAQADVYLGHMRYPVLNVGSLNEAAMEVNGGDYLVATHGTVLGVAVSALASRLVCGQYCMKSEMTCGLTSVSRMFPFSRIWATTSSSL